MSKRPNKGSTPKHVRDNRANQLNPQHPAYHQSRGSSPKSAQSNANSNKGNSPKK